MKFYLNLGEIELNDSWDVPSELKQQNQWVNWAYIRKKEGQMAKIPLDPKTAGWANVANPSTWSSFDTAVQRAQTDPWVNGIGYVFTSSDPFTGVDFDHCRNPETGEIDPLVLARITALDSYAEISASGEGVHVIVRAALSGQGCRKGFVELYDCARFFIVTGNHINGFPMTVNERQSEIDALQKQLFLPKTARAVPVCRQQSLVLDDDVLIARILESRQGEKFERLQGGNWSDYDSQSEADLALCAILSFWTQDNVQIDRIFRTTALFRAKWDEVHHRAGLAYGEITIRKALDGSR